MLHKIIKTGLIASIILSPVSLFINVESDGGLLFETKLFSSTAFIGLFIGALFIVYNLKGIF